MKIIRKWFLSFIIHLIYILVLYFPFIHLPHCHLFRFNLFVCSHSFVQQFILIISTRKPFHATDAQSKVLLAIFSLTLSRSLKYTMNKVLGPYYLWVIDTLQSHYLSWQLLLSSTPKRVRYTFVQLCCMAYYPYGHTVSHFISADYLTTNGFSNH